VAKVIVEGLEMDDSNIPTRTGKAVRLGPINVAAELRDAIETMATEESRSISNCCVLLIERGLLWSNKQKNA
jgi:hypothetical protein